MSNIQAATKETLQDSTNFQLTNKQTNKQTNKLLSMFHPRHVGPVPLPVCKSVLLASPGNDANTVLPVLSIQERTKWPPEFRGKQHKWDSENYTTFSSIWIYALSSSEFYLYQGLLHIIFRAQNHWENVVDFTRHPDEVLSFWLDHWITDFSHKIHPTCSLLISCHWNLPSNHRTSWVSGKNSKSLDPNRNRISGNGITCTTC